MVELGRGGLAFSRVELPEAVVSPPDPDPSYHNATDEVVVAGAPYYGLGGCCVTDNGTVLVVVRDGTTHLAGGSLVKFTSTDDGITWSAPTEVRNNSKDIRDCDLATLANGDVILTFTERTDSEFATDFIPYAMKSTDDGVTWGSAVAITNGFSGWSFISARVLELGNGDLLAPLYGNDGTTDYCRVSKSTDGGATWSALSTIVAAGVSSRVWHEPYLTRDGTTIYCAIRSDTATGGIYLCTSTDGGATWSAPVRQFDGSGRPAIFHTQNDDLAIMYRELSSLVTAARFSFDDAASWTSPFMFNSSAEMLYGSWVDLPGNVIGAVWAVEQHSSRGDVLFDTFTYDPD